MFAYMYGIVLKGSFTNVHFNKQIQSYKHQAICGMDWQVPAQKWTWISDEEKLLQFYLRVTSQGALTKKVIGEEGFWVGKVFVILEKKSRHFNFLMALPLIMWCKNILTKFRLCRLS